MKDGETTGGNTFVRPNQGISGVRSPEGNVLVWQRDLANNLPVLLQNAARLTQTVLGDDMEAMLLLDKFTRFLAASYVDMRKKPRSAPHVFGEFLKEIEENKAAPKALACFGWFLVVSIYAFLFGTQEISTQAPARFDDDCMSFLGIVAVMSLIRDEELLRQISRYVRVEGLLNPRYDLRGMTHITQTFAKEIEEAQRKLLSELEARR